jgi:N-acetylneuraminic acid mutarotase
MIIWGGRNGGTLANDGAAYDPATDKWSPLPDTGAPSAREGHIAVWTGSEMIVFGGTDSGGVAATGAAYNPATGKWRPLTNPGSPVARTSATAAWTGTEVLVFGGQGNTQPVAALQRLAPQPAWYFYRKP